MDSIVNYLWCVKGITMKLNHIKAEKASESFYLAQESYDKAFEELEKCRQQKDDAENQRDKFVHMVKVLNAAKEYAELLEMQNDE